MGLFRPYKQGQTETETVKGSGQQESGSTGAQADDRRPEQAEAPAEETAQPHGRSAKTGPTPTRAQAEAARMARLHPNLSRKEVRRRDRRAREQRRLSSLESLEKRPERAMIRDYVDSRRTFGEYIMPIFLIIMAAWLAIIMFLPEQIVLVNLLSLVMLLTMIGWGIDTWRLWRGVRKELAARFPQVPRKGLLSYLNNRVMTPRRWRNPAPAVERGGAARTPKG
ncbi:DUF3043 domain-containing protein [Acidipropionibacterium virtanenii]|uniref:DUF3043 domain-containing protein n=1 Tax=Acidipropionibacterium virtanenii TaxID=2057246 RepID=A0A344UVF7_9ACTN|nr:DUF3043 domain-containing protein [Acidipropionibacterium virtanenii]AXE39255.1 hypothetical protein JS278_02103 [Acidipropionibacterium virtanenii]